MGMTEKPDWYGDNPFFLVIETSDGMRTGIDLDKPGWASEHAELMRKTGKWVLVHKHANQAVIVVLVDEGDQPYYTARHLGSTAATHEIIAYGMGKKTPDGQTHRIWFLPGGVVTTAEDVDRVGISMIQGKFG